MKPITFLVAVCLSTSFGFFPQQSLAQADTQLETTQSATPQPFAGDVAGVCADYFQPERVRISIPGDVPEVQPGTQFSLSGVIVNENPVALAGVSIIVKVFKQQGDEPSVATDVVVDQFIAVENIGLGSNRETPFTFSWDVPAAIEQGVYYFQYALYLQNQVALAGDLASDDNMIGLTPLTVGGADAGSLVQFLKDQTTLGGSIYDFTDIPTIGRNDTVAATTVISNSSQSEKTVTVQWMQYANHSLNETNLRYTQTEVVTIPAGETRELRYDVIGQLESKTHLTATLQDGDVTQLLNLPFVRTDGFEVFTPFVGLTDFPLQTGRPVSLVACTLAPYSTLLPDVTVEMKLLDEAGTVLSEYSQTSILLEDSNAFTKEFTPSTDLKAVTLQVRLLLGGGEVQSFAIPFSCEQFAPEVCGITQAAEQDPVVDTSGFSRAQMIMIILGGVLLMVLISGTIWVRRKKKPAELELSVPLEDVPHYK